MSESEKSPPFYHSTRRCAHCRKPFVPANSKNRFCSRECAARYYRKQSRTFPKKKHTKSLEEWQREAEQCGMTYGKYRAAVEQLGKTFEELKLNYENNHL